MRPSSHGVRALGQELNLARRSHFRLAGAWPRVEGSALALGIEETSPETLQCDFEWLQCFQDYGDLPDTYKSEHRARSVCYLGNVGGTQVQKSVAVLLL